MPVSRMKSGDPMLLGALLWSSEAVAQQRPRLLVPVSHACISSPFGPRVLPNHPQAGTFHYGIDLPAPEVAPVRAAGPGVLLRVRRNGPGGLELIVQHGGLVGVSSRLGVFDPKMDIGGNVRIRGGEQLGVVGRTGVGLGPHLGILQSHRLSIRHLSRGSAILMAVVRLVQPEIQPGLPKRRRVWRPPRRRTASASPLHSTG